MDIPRYRIGNDLTVLWAICNNDGTPFDLSGKGVRLFVTNERGMTEVVPTITTDKNGSITNVILWTFLGNNQKVLGKHTLTVEIVTADDKRVIKRDISDAFNLVARSEGEESGGEANAVDSGTIYLSTKLDVYRFGNARVEIGTNGNWFIDGYDTGRTALAGEPGIVHYIYTESDLGKEFDPDSKIDTFNAHAINAIYNALKRMTLKQLQDLSLADLEEYDVLAYNGNAWLNVPFRDLLNIFMASTEAQGESFWKLSEDGKTIVSDYGIRVKGNAFVEGDTASSGTGNPTSDVGGSIANLADVRLVDLKDNQILVYDNTSRTWKNRDNEGGSGGSGNYVTQDDLNAALKGKVDTTRKIIASGGLTGGGALSADLQLSLVSLGNSGTFVKVTVDQYGRVTSGSTSIAQSEVSGLSSALGDRYTKSELSAYITWMNSVKGYISNTNNNIRIGTNLIVAGDTASTSDMRLKDKIEDVILDLDTMAQMPLFTFKWNDGRDDDVHLGSSAQYWEAHREELVQGDDVKSLNYAALGAAMGKSLAVVVSGLVGRIEELEAEIKRLKGGNA